MIAFCHAESFGSAKNRPVWPTVAHVAPGPDAGTFAANEPRPRVGPWWAIGGRDRSRARQPERPATGLPEPGPRLFGLLCRVLRTATGAVSGERGCVSDPRFGASASRSFP